MRAFRPATLPALLFALCALLIALPTHAVSTTLVLNELDYDQAGTDSAEYVEIKNASDAVISLDGWALRFVNGSAAGGPAEYRIVNLPGVELAAGAYFVVCANDETVANCDLDADPDTDFVQNGAPDAVELLQSGVRVDVLSYEGDTAGYTEGSGAGSDTASGDEGLSRCPDGADTDNNAADWALRPITPGEANDCPADPGTPTPPPPGEAREIWEVQGAGHLSPHDGARVQLDGNIVTARLGNGFFMQTPTERSDDDLATSDALFVFMDRSPAVAVGDVVNVNGVVDEFRPGSASDGNLTITEITGPSVTVVSSGNPLPAPVVLGRGGRVPPGRVIDDDGLAAYDPAGDGIDFYESLEAMRVQVNDAHVVGPTQSFSGGSIKETWVVADDSADAGPDTARGGVYITPTDFNPERIQLDARNNTYPGGGAAWTDLDVGGQLDGPAVGVVHYSFGNFEVLLTEAVTVASASGVSRESAIFVGDEDRLTVATFNVENLGGNAGSAEFSERATLIVNSLRSPDIVVLEEMQDNGGEGTGSSAADETFTRLIAAIQAAGGPAYEYRQIDPVNNQDGGAPNGNIRVGFLFNPARAGFTDRPGGDATTPVAVVCTDGEAALSASPGRIDPSDAAWNASRKPLVGEFTFQGETIFIVGVHFASKGGDDPLFGATQPPELSSEPRRLEQATLVNAFVGDLLACDPDAAAVVLGDVNDFHFSPVAQALAGDELINLMALLPENERYSYVYQGNSQVLDQALATAGLTDRFVEYDVVHVNSEFVQQASDHDPGVARFWMNGSPQQSPAIWLPVISRE